MVGGGVRDGLTCPIALDVSSAIRRLQRGGAGLDLPEATFPRPFLFLQSLQSYQALAARALFGLLEPKCYFPISSFKRCWASLSASSAVCWPLMTEVKA
jgi:hypothetical protein